MFIKTILLVFVWNALTLAYYGISLGITSIDAINHYYMYFLSSIAELVGYIISNVNDTFGHRKTFFTFLLI